ncbi:MAG TPA: hypothetical protein VHW02_07750 [Rhizomicrobium sp.]|jgi:hypothetical protein|nr:hypothetical protein [Rhizomicrobium sp.]
MGAAHASDSETVREFRTFSAHHGRAVSALENARATVATGSERHDFALSMQTAIENEFARCFVMTRKPDWQAVERAAKGEDG